MKKVKILNVVNCLSAHFIHAIPRLHSRELSISLWPYLPKDMCSLRFCHLQFEKAQIEKKKYMVGVFSFLANKGYNL